MPPIDRFGNDISGPPPQGPIKLIRNSTGSEPRQSDVLLLPPSLVASYDSTQKAVSVALSARQEMLTRAQGLIAETVNRNNSFTTAVLISGSVYYVSVPLLAGDVVTNLITMVGTAGVGVTVSKMGLYNASTGARLAVSADQATAWESTGIKTVPMVTPYVVPANGVYYAAIIAVAGTVPGFPRLLTTTGTTPATFIGAINGGIQPMAIQTGQTDLPLTATFAATAGQWPWIGVT